MDRFRPGWVYDTTDLDPEQSDTIEGLAGKLGLDPVALQETVDEFNAAQVKIFVLSNWANPINVAPFYG